eukprot:14180801-Heterocapsa_arctica.AAC.1
MAFRAYEDEKMAPATSRTRDSRLDWWKRRATVRGIAPYPLSVAKLQLAGALLKAGRYRSAD